MDDDKIVQVAKWLTEANFGFAFTGAGTSTESGIPDFRSPGGIWYQSQPVMFDDFLASDDARYEYWRQKSVSHQDFGRSKPNLGHELLATWESRRWLQGVITQNIDGLHQDAGSESVVELHGTARFISCLDCEARYNAGPMVKEFLKNDSVPPCPNCSEGRLKHATISFGQQLDPVVLQKATDWCKTCDLLVVLGSSLVVQPAASLPEVVKRHGGRVAIINRDPTPQDDIVDIVIHAPIGETLSEIEAAATF